MKKGDIVAGKILRTAFPNKGVLEVEGEMVAVKGVLPGQTVEVRIHKTRKGKAEGNLLRVVTPSECETAVPSCPHYGTCGGCALQTLPYEEQLKLKEQQIRDLLEPVLQLDPANACEWLGILKSPKAYEYRNKMEFSFGDEYKDGPLALGLHKKGSFYDLVTTNHCQLVNNDLLVILEATLKFTKEAGLTYYHKMKKSGCLRHLLLRRAEKTGEILIDLVSTTQTEVDLKPWVQMLCKLEQDGALTGTITGILHTTNDSEGDTIINDGTELLYGRDCFYEEILGLRFRISPFSFFQTNSLGAEVLYDCVRKMVGETKGILFDLYSGTGTIGQLLAPVAKQVIGVELIPEAVEAANENAKQNGLGNCRFIAGDVLKMLDTIEERPDYIVLDPPREGIVPKALEKIIAYGVDRLVYISCKPTSLARDLVVLMEAGYEVKKVCCVDMFPQTPHVETVCLLSRK